MIDLKYHIYSLVAIFLALAVGILIGGSLGGGLTGNEAIERQREAIERLNKEFQAHQVTLAERQSALDALNRGLRQADVLVEGLYAPLVADQLAGRGVAIVQFGQSEEIAAACQTALERAGATVHSTTRIDVNYGFDNPEQMSKAAQSVPLEFQDTSKEFYQQVWGYVGTVLTAGREGQPFQNLASAGVLQTDGDYSKPNRFTVLIIPRTVEIAAIREILLIPILSKLKSDNMGIVLAGSVTPGSDSTEELWTQMDVPTVTHANMAFGQICLVEALVKGEGHYGLGAAEELLPVRLTAR